MPNLENSFAEVPPIWPLEVANVLAVNEKRRRLSAATSEAFLRTLSRLDIRIDAASPAIDGRVLLPLVRKHKLTAYDAAYLELAIRKGLALASLDDDLLRAAASEGVTVVR